VRHRREDRQARGRRVLQHSRCGRVHVGAAAQLEHRQRVLRPHIASPMMTIALAEIERICASVMFWSSLFRTSSSRCRCRTPRGRACAP
jgi:hypothetical protein